jgi:ABC-type nitrate/sulfonate/bicarbonate transport system substrate-binding protein
MAKADLMCDAMIDMHERRLSMKRTQRVGGRTLAPVLTLALLAGACSTNESSESAGEGAAGKAPVTIDIGLPTGVTSFANSDVVLAERRGFFRAAGITVRWKNFRSGVSVVQGVVGGSLDVGGASIEPVVNAEARGGGLSIIGAYADKLTVSMVTPKDIAKPADLKGKRLGVQEVGAFREVMTRMVLQDAGLTRDDVQYVPVDAQAYISALSGGKVQSAILQTEQAFAAQQANPRLHQLVDLNALNPDYFYGAYFVTKKWLSENRDAAKGFLTAITRAHRFMYENKAESVPILAKATGFGEAVINQTYEQLLVKQGVFPVNEGLDPARIQKTIAQMRQYKILEGTPPAVNSLVDRSLIGAVVKELGPMRGDARWH